MKRREDRHTTVLSFLRDRKIATLKELKAILGTEARMTVFRTLRRLGYHSSYSHRGQFYTLCHIPDFDELGLWSYRFVQFSRYGNLLATAKILVEQAKSGYTAVELEDTLHVEAKHALLQLTRGGKIVRCKIGHSHVYMSAEDGKRRQQQLIREGREAHVEIGLGLSVETVPDKIKAAIILFFSMLTEKQRRIYAGLEAVKIGHGGDRKMAELLGLDVHTIAKGRMELFEEAVDRNGIRKEGGGRKRVEKKTCP